MTTYSFNRRRLFTMTAYGALGAALPPVARSALAETIDLPFANGERQIAPAGTFPEKAAMIIHRTRPPLLETPWSVLGQHVFTPNESFYVRWHLGDFPTHVDIASYRIRVYGAVDALYEISLKDLAADFDPIDLAAVNQCSGNSRGRVEPRVPGAQWADGAMGNAMWTGVPISQIIARAKPRANASHVAFRSMERLVSMFPDKDIYEKVLPLEKAMDGNVMAAYGMNGEQMPVLNGSPVRLVVPGWYATYWVKMLSEIEVTTHPGEKFWMAGAYKIPDRPNGSIRPGETGVNYVPISAMNPRSFFSNAGTGDRISSGADFVLRGLAFGGNSAVRSVDISLDEGRSWEPASLGKDWGDFSFRQWSFRLPAGRKGKLAVIARVTSALGERQPLQAGWNGGGFMYNPAPRIDIEFV
ncbi:Mo-co oxidoreductase dimerisation domain-containing protein [Azospirillum oryzae]|uniref:Mo-co oxidoreductase dimerisation domain-containing protein n=1 Tax=Azospirillum oryzae TaxID=286727 RepID=A0A1X7HNB9_9PROT|nr:molybdopterin-dependent oxidoreductase [Azospirillum oryzae]SMF88853.1 Mo-co oxidoreductase dimerisation domain-containing protein [Azospirillum oryzae]